VLTYDRFSHDPLAGVQTELEKYTYCIVDILLDDSLRCVPEVVLEWKIYQHSNHKQMTDQVCCSLEGFVHVHSLDGCQVQDWMSNFCCIEYMTTLLQHLLHLLTGRREQGSQSQEESH
jgi:hypothetical protein